MRAVSTVLDVTVCLLLVSAAVLVVALPETGPPPERTVDETATLLATTTGDVEYRLSTEAFEGGATGTDTHIEESRWLHDRTRHGTVAGLLARAAVANATLDGRDVAPETVGFRRAVRDETRPLLPERTSVQVRWEPYPDAPLSGTIQVGEPPPAGVDTRVATLTIPVPDFAERETDPARSYDAVATATATAIVKAMAPRPAGELPASDRLIVRATMRRYSVFASGSKPAAVDPTEADPARLEKRAIDGLAGRLAADMRAEFDTPAEAAAATEPGVVRIRVTRWSP